MGPFCCSLLLWCVFVLCVCLLFVLCVYRPEDNFWESFLFPLCLSGCFYCFDEGFVWLTLPFHCLSLKEGKTGAKTEQKPEGRSWCRGHGRVWLTSLLFMAWSACLLIEPTTHHRLGTTSLIINWKIKCFIAEFHESISSTEIPFSVMTLTFVIWHTKAYRTASITLF